MISNVANHALFTAVLTRPAGQAAALARYLARDGIATLEFPLIEIEPVSDADMASFTAAFTALERYALVVFVSPNAVGQSLMRLNAASWRPWPAAVPIGVVGPGSVAALAEYGIARPDYQVIAPVKQNANDALQSPSRYDSEALLAALDAALGLDTLAGRPVLLVRGGSGRELLADTLREHGARVMTVTAYRRALPKPPLPLWRAVYALLAGQPHAWVLTSSESMRNLAELAGKHLTDRQYDILKHTPMIALHPRIAESAQALGFDTITFSDAGDQAIGRALFSLAAIAKRL